MRRGAGVRAVLALAVLCGAVAGAGRARADRKQLPESNLAILDRALAGVARRLVAQAPVTPGMRLALARAAADKLIAHDVERAVLEALTERKMDVWLVAPGGAADTAGAAAGTTAGDSTNVRDLRRRQAQARTGGAFDSGGDAPSLAEAAAAELPLLTVNVEEARVDYPRLYRSGLFGGMHVERRALVRLSARLLRPDTRAIYWVGTTDTSIADAVSRSELLMLEDPNRPETKGTVPTQSWQKAIEPVLVVVLVAGLVSLFYTNRP